MSSFTKLLLFMSITMVLAVITPIIMYFVIYGILSVIELIIKKRKKGKNKNEEI